MYARLKERAGEPRRRKKHGYFCATAAGAGSGFFSVRHECHVQQSGKDGRRKAGATAENDDGQPAGEYAAGRRHHHSGAVLLGGHGNAGGSGQFRHYEIRPDAVCHLRRQYRHDADGVDSLPFRHPKRQYVAEDAEARKLFSHPGHHRRCDDDGGQKG